MRTYEMIFDRLFTSGHTKRRKLYDKLNTLDFLGVTYVVNLTRSVDEELQEHFGDKYLHRPVPDGRVNTNHLAVADEVFKLLQDNKRVLVHCNAGQNRAPFIAALVRRAWYGGVEVELIRQIRPNALTNEYFVNWLKLRRDGSQVDP